MVVDVETGGFNEQTDALLEIAAVLLNFDDQGRLHLGKKYQTHVTPFDGSNLEPKSLEINGIDPYHPLRAAREEREALAHIFQPVREAVSAAGCTRAILVGHNAFFDLKFVNAAADRCNIKKEPVSSVQLFRHGFPVRSGVWTDGIGTSGGRCRHGMGHRRSSRSTL